LTPKLIVNENFPAPAVSILREAGVDVLAVQEAMAGASDEVVLQRAVQDGRWLVTFDRDYGELVFSRRARAPAAILYLRQEPVPFSRIADMVRTALAAPNEMIGNMVVIGQRTVRRRPLPVERD
jgi:predicted nuclease of predicted toxin-antitoxin system